MKRRGKSRCNEVDAAGVGRVAHLQRQAEHRPRGIDADLAHHVQGVVIRAEQDVLPIVERSTLVLDTPRAPASGACRLEQRHAHAAPRQLDRR